MSNHGGRQLDHALGSLDVLPEVVEAVGGKATIVIDGGVQRGSDVLKAIALGADAVAIGKLWAWGQGAAGTAGVTRVLEILENEIVSAMGLMGVTCIDQLGPQYLTRAERVTQPHEMSAWVNPDEPPHEPLSQILGLNTYSRRDNPISGRGARVAPPRRPQKVWSNFCWLNRPSRERGKTALDHGPAAIPGRSGSRGSRDGRRRRASP